MFVVLGWGVGVIRSAIVPSKARSEMGEVGKGLTEGRHPVPKGAFSVHRIPAPGDESDDDPGHQII